MRRYLPAMTKKDFLPGETKAQRFWRLRQAETDAQFRLLKAGGLSEYEIAYSDRATVLESLPR